MRNYNLQDMNGFFMLGQRDQNGRDWPFHSQDGEYLFFNFIISTSLNIWPEMH